MQKLKALLPVVLAGAGSALIFAAGIDTATENYPMAICGAVLGLTGMLLGRRSIIADIRSSLVRPPNVFRLFQRPKADQ